MAAGTMCGRPIVVTGGTGFVGARLAARLAESGANVHVVARPASDPWRLAVLGPAVTRHGIDLGDRTAVHRLIEEIAPRRIYHLAAYRGAADDETAAFATNVTGLRNLLEAVDDYIDGLEGFVHFSSSTEYGPRPDAASEDHPLAPTTVHGRTKAAATRLLQEWSHTRRAPAVILRLFHVYGPWDRPDRFIPRLVDAALHDRPMPLTPPGCRHDWTFVEDVIDAALLASRIRLPPGTVVNIASGRDWPNEEVLACVEHLIGHRIAVSPGRCAARSWDAPRWVADISRARRMLGWAPAHDLAAGLSATIDWHRRVAAEPRAH